MNGRFAWLKAEMMAFATGMFVPYAEKDEEY